MLIYDIFTENISFLFDVKSGIHKHICDRTSAPRYVENECTINKFLHAQQSNKIKKKKH